MACTEAACTPPRRTVAMLNQKGGVGKTTSTVNLGAALARDGRRVCLVDLDPQAHLTLHLGIDTQLLSGTIYDLMIDPDLAAPSLIVPVRENLDVLPAEVDLAAVDVELAGHPDRQRILCQRFEAVRDRYDVILLDCPPSLGLLTLNALSLADEVFVPMQAHFLALQGVGKLLETVGLVCRSVNRSLAVSGIILCMHESQTTLAREVVADLEGFFEQCRDQDVPWRDCRVLHPPVRRNIKLAEAPSFGQTIFDYAPWCPGAIDYRLLARRIVERWWPAQTTRGHEPVPMSAPAGESREQPTVKSPPPTASAVEPKPRPPSSPSDPPAADAITAAAVLQPAGADGATEPPAS